MKKRKMYKKGLIGFTICGMVITLNYFPYQKEQIQAAGIQNKMEPQVYKTGTYTLSNVNIRGGDGQSAIKIEGDVTLNIEGDVNLTGGDAYFQNTYTPIGAGAGIEVPAGSTLTLKGSGTLHTQGGSAANGRNGVDGPVGFDKKNGNSIEVTKHSPSGLQTLRDKFILPNSSEGGQGGAGAGAGIGGKGADNTTLTPSVGTVQVADKHLAVEANGGIGGRSGGKGGKGGTGGLRYATVLSQMYVVYAGEQIDAAWQGAWGGQGGGGAGYPAAGIGSGGAAGGHGGNAQDQNRNEQKTTTTYSVFWLTIPYWDFDYFNLHGGNGGSGGKGYVSGGGGGGGSLTKGWTQTRDISNDVGVYGEADQTTLAPGGDSGQDGGYSYPKSAKVTKGRIAYPRYDPNCVYAGQPGRAGEGYRQGSKANGGSFILNGGSVYSVGGGGKAQDIGSGDGLGEDSGTVQIHGGDLTTKANAMATPTNGKEKVYPVTLRPKQYTYSADNTLKTNVKINDKDWNIGRFSLGNKEGVLHAYLPNGTYKVGVSDPEGIYDSNYDFDVKGQATVPQSKDAQGLILDSSKGNIVFYKNHALQAGTSYLYGGTATITTSGNTGYNIDYDPDATAMQHKLILQNAKIKELNASKDPERYAKVNVEIQGKENAIQYITVFNAQSNVTFSGDENSNIDVTTIAGNPAGLADYGDNSKLEEEMYQITFNYISDVALAVNEYANKKGHKEIAVAANQLKAKGYTPLLRGNGNYVDLNAGRAKNTNAIAIGYKTTTDPDEALVDLWAAAVRGSPLDDKIHYSFGETQFGREPLKNITGWPGSLNVNSGPGQDSIDKIYLFQGRVKEEIRTHPYQPYPTPISAVGVYTQNDTGNHLDHTFYDSYVKNQYYDDKAHKAAYNDMNLNEGGGGNYIYLAYGNKLPVVKKDEKKYIANGSISNNYNWFDGKYDSARQYDPTHAKLLDAPKIDSPDFHAGSIVMNSKGVVHVGDIYSYANSSARDKTGRPRWVYETGVKTIHANIWGTPNFTVNSGYMKFDNYLKSKKEENFEYMYWPDLSTRSQGETWYLYNLIPTGFSKGNNKLGDIHVNGGTLQVGDGRGDFTVPQELSSLEKPVINVKTGGNLLAAQQSVKDQKTKLEITGLPKNEHLHFIKESDSGRNIGNYHNIDAWTNEYGNYITYLGRSTGEILSIYDDDNDKRFVFADDEGNAYVYRIENRQANKVNLTDYSNADPNRIDRNPAVKPTYKPNDAVLRIEPKYKVQRNEIYDGNDTIHLKGDLPGGILFANQASLTIDNTDLRTIDSIHGNGNLRISGVGVKVTKDITVPTNISSGSSEINAMSAPLTMTGGSLKTPQPLQGVRNDKEEVYQCVLPTWDTNVLVDGKAYPMSGKSVDGKMYLYVPKGTKTIQVGMHTYVVTFNDTSKIMNIREQKDGDGNIDIAKGSVEILGNHLYTYNGELYKNSKGDTYSIHGTSHENTLMVTGDNADITLDGVDMQNTNSPISINAGVKASVLVKGDVHITSSSSSAIHVPTGAALTMKGSGHLFAESRGLGATIGGGASEVNGNVTITAGTVDLQTKAGIAIGAGYGATTPEKSIIVTGGSIYGTLGTTAVNAQQEALTRIVLEPKNVKDIKVAGKDYFVEQANKDGKLYLYVKAEEQKVTVGSKDYTAQPVKLKELTNGSMELSVESDKGDIPLTDKNLIVEGTQVRVATKPDKGYGIKSGPAAGMYEVVKDGKDLKLTPRSGFNDTLNLLKWNLAEKSDQPNEVKENNILETNVQLFKSLILRSSEHDAVEKKEAVDDNGFAGFTKNIQKDKPEKLALGEANAGEAVVTVNAKGSGVTMDILVNEKVVKTQTLTDDVQAVKYQWKTEGKDAVSVCFHGTGTVTLTTLLLSNIVAVNNIDATFAPVVTLKLNQQIDSSLDPHDDFPGSIGLLQKGGQAPAIDRNPSEAGFQFFQNEEVQLMYFDPDGGSKFASYTITPKDGEAMTINENPYVLKMDKDIQVDVTTQKEPYYVITIPESVDLNDTAQAPIQANEIKNLPEGQEVKVKIGSGIQNSKMMLNREGDHTNGISIPIEWNKKAIPEDGILARFDANTKEIKDAGNLTFMKPEDSSVLAGKYSGTINFEISIGTK